MDEMYKQMMRQNLKMTGMTDEQIDAILAMQDPANIDMSSLGQEIQDVAGDLWEEDEAAIQQFIQDNPVQPGKEKYMLIGALLLATHGEPWQVLAMMNEKDYWKDVLKEGWDIKTVSAGRKMLASLLEGRHALAYGDDFRKFKSGKPHELDEESVENYNDTLDGLEEDLPELLPYAKKCDNILAWDLERVGYLARIFHLLAWIDEAETFDWLTKAAEKIKSNYASWEEYIAAILVGRAVAFSFDYIMIGVAQEIVTNGKAFLDKYPIKKL